MKEFLTAAREIDPDEERDVYRFTIDGVECTAHRPKDGQFAVLMATTGRHSSVMEQIAGFTNFFVAVLDEQSHSYVVSRLLDSDDDFGLDEMQQIMSWLVEEWGGRPTQSPSVSTPSRQNGGRRSTRRTPALTSSDSLSTGS
jgi:hypothetical protein